MNPRLIPMLLLNTFLIISIIFFGNDARTIIVLFLIEILIFCIFRFIIKIRNAEKNTKPGKLCERTKIITKMIFITLSISVMIVMAGTLAKDKIPNTNNLISILYENMWIILSMILIETISMIKHFYNNEKTDKAIEYGYAKILLAIVLLYIIGPLFVILERIIQIEYQGLSLFAIICVLSKIAIDYWAIKNTEIASTTS